MDNFKVKCPRCWTPGKDFSGNSMDCLRKKRMGPGRCGSVGRASSCKAKGHWLGPSQATCLGRRVGPQSGHIQEATDRCLSLTLIFLSLSPSLLPTPLTKNKYIKSFKKRIGGRTGVGRHWLTQNLRAQGVSRMLHWLRARGVHTGPTTRGKSRTFPKAFLLWLYSSNTCLQLGRWAT